MNIKMVYVKDSQKDIKSISWFIMKITSTLWTLFKEKKVLKNENGNGSCSLLKRSTLIGKT